VFDFANGGELVSVVLAPVGSYQARGREMPCLRFRSVGYWRGVGNYEVMPRFLACCKARYLENLEFGTDYGEDEYFLGLCWEDDANRARIASLSEDEFFERIVDKHGPLA